MKKLYINTGGFDAVFNNFKDSFGGKLIISANEYKLTFKSRWAKGSITGVRFEKEMTYLNFDFTFNEDVNLSIESNPFTPVFFVYCEKGNVQHSFGANGNVKGLNKNQSGIMCNSSTINSVLYFDSHKHIQFSLIGMPTAVNNEETDFVSQIKKTFTNESGNYIYIGTENHKIEQKFEELKTIAKKGTVRYLMMRNILREVLQLEIAQHSYNYLSTFNPILHFASRQINEIKKLSTLSVSTVTMPLQMIRRSLQSRTLKQKYQLELKSYNQKLAS
ncbi:hypothetical protein [Flavobacterium quisquiliarum]|uniref:AraC family transcriptional regulator n=1 Tax=Flavobacterium quisquiliarum TaxID=1834436 RepID=A0ABV8W116_9FLAO|nr:hypothetical protein [Flavobacterium quisquiliarum]MBW1655792.1 hypothetical protein [Flavobacterium quisquiliarum]NWL01461.1 hypothetical protein [Flavobacterium collinsii]